MKGNKPLLLIIRDGWGISARQQGNAVAAAKKPNYDRFMKERPHSIIKTSGEAVGLVEGSQGSSEVGHLNLGAGRIVEQEVIRINKMIRSGAFFTDPVLMRGVENCKKHESAIHFMGLVQDEGVHAMDMHLYALLELAKRHGLCKVFVHFFSDGRDTPPQSALTFLERLERKVDEIGCGSIATVMGRYWSMDRDNNFERTRKAYDCLRQGKGLTASSARAAIEQAYARAEKQKAAKEAIVENDEFILPTAIAGKDGKPFAGIGVRDTVIHFNYRQDRAIQLTRAFKEPGRCGAPFAGVTPFDVCYLGLTRYYDEFTDNVLPPMNMDNLFGEWLGGKGINELRIAETQKFKHVTSFFNGKAEAPFKLEERILVDSPKVTEDKQPEMSAFPVTELALTAIEKGIAAAREKAKGMAGVTLTVGEGIPAADEPYDVIIINYANCDMVGHTGVFAAAVRAVETVDDCMGRVTTAALARGGTVLITSDHGNAEMMANPDTGAVVTSHTIFDVELIFVSDSVRIRGLKNGILADIAPTMLQILELPQPAEMTGQSLLEW
jgi:2,3-bisphosphoglycerate-independent phosphoglycerate mutase